MGGHGGQVGEVPHTLTVRQFPIAVNSAISWPCIAYLWVIDVGRLAGRC